MPALIGAATDHSTIFFAELQYDVPPSTFLSFILLIVHFYLQFIFTRGSKDPEDLNIKLKSKVGMARGLVLHRRKALVY